MRVGREPQPFLPKVCFGPTLKTPKEATIHPMPVAAAHPVAPRFRRGRWWAVLGVALSVSAIADEPHEPLVPQAGEYTGQILIPNTTGFGIGGTMTDEPCAVTITHQADGRAAAAVSFLAAEGPLPLEAAGDGMFWAALDERRAVVLRVGQSGGVMLATHTGRDADGRPHQAFLGFGEFVQECVIES